jgi:diketogulonate reductase-like aldo/keto reductase
VQAYIVPQCNLYVLILELIVCGELSQVTYSVIDTRPEKKMVAWCLQHDVKLLAYGCVPFRNFLI